MAVSEIAREEVATVSPDASVEEVVATMVDLGVGSVVVADENLPIGIITDRDVVIRVHGADADPETLTARDVMSENLVTVTGEEGVYDLLRAMAENGVRRVPVVDDGELVGIVTLDDVLLLVGMEMQSIAQLIRAESPPFETPATQLYEG